MGIFVASSTWVDGPPDPKPAAKHSFIWRVTHPFTQFKKLKSGESVSSRIKRFGGIFGAPAKPQTPVSEIVASAKAGDLPLCDLSNHRQILVMDSAKKNALLAEVATATAVGAVALHSLKLDDTKPQSKPE